MGVVRWITLNIFGRLNLYVKVHVHAIFMHLLTILCINISIRRWSGILKVNLRCAGLWILRINLLLGLTLLSIALNRLHVSNAWQGWVPQTSWLTSFWLSNWSHFLLFFRMPILFEVFKISFSIINNLWHSPKLISFTVNLFMTGMPKHNNCGQFFQCTKETLCFTVWQQIPSF